MTGQEQVTATAEAVTWVIEADDTWMTFVGPGAVELIQRTIAFVPRPAGDTVGAWKIPTCLAVPVLKAALAGGVELLSIRALDGTDGVLRYEVGRNGEVYVLPPIPQDAPDPVREGLERLAEVVRTDLCRCGSMARVDPQRRVHDVRHDSSCPAMDSNLRRALIAWLGN